MTVTNSNSTAAGTTNGVNLQLPVTFQFPAATTPNGYYWVYLRRPANPFDTAVPNQVRPNKEMVVVDAMRFPYINATDATVMPNAAPVPPTVTKSANQVFSAQRLQPYRGGHLVPVDTPPPTTPNLLPAGGATTICPPSPAYAYGYSEQSAPPVASAPTSFPRYTYSTTAAGPPPSTTTTNLPTALNFMQSINSATGGTRDSNWSPFPFHDRDFASVAELLLVPGCPPGLFTKQFVEEKYPGNVTDSTTGNVATGMDYRTVTPTAYAPPKTSASVSDTTHAGRANFNAGSGEIPARRSRICPTTSTTRRPRWPRPSPRGRPRSTPTTPT